MTDLGSRSLASEHVVNLFALLFPLDSEGFLPVALNGGHSPAKHPSRRVVCQAAGKTLEKLPSSMGFIYCPWLPGSFVCFSHGHGLHKAARLNICCPIKLARDISLAAL